jgi:hypothetical protein
MMKEARKMVPGQTGMAVLLKAKQAQLMAVNLADRVEGGVSVGPSTPHQRPSQKVMTEAEAAAAAEAAEVAAAVAAATAACNGLWLSANSR